VVRLGSVPDLGLCGGRVPRVRGRALLGRLLRGQDQPVVAGVVEDVDGLGDDELIGVVAVGRAYPSWLESLATATPNLLTYLGLATAISVVARCSWRGG
jgi:two-component system, CitB family, sensor kinase